MIKGEILRRIGAGTGFMVLSSSEISKAAIPLGVPVAVPRLSARGWDILILGCSTSRPIRKIAQRPRASWAFRGRNDNESSTIPGNFESRHGITTAAIDIATKMGGGIFERRNHTRTGKARSSLSLRRMAASNNSSTTRSSLPDFSEASTTIPFLAGFVLW